LLIFAVMLGASLQRDRIFPLYLIFDYLTPLSTFGLNGPPLKHFQHLWAVMVEMQIYLLFPFLHRFGREQGTRYLVGIVSLLLVLRLMGWLVTGTAQTVSYWTIFGRLDQFVIGMLLAEFSHRNEGRFRNPLWLAGALAVVYGTMLWLDRLGGFYGNGIPSPNPIWIARPLIEAAAWGSLVVAYLHTSFTPGRLGARVLSRLGEISYSIYVVHLLVFWSAWPFVEQFTFAQDLELNAVLNGVLIVLPLTCALSFATYRLVERPFLRMRRHYLSPLPVPLPANAGEEAVTESRPGSARSRGPA
jgi:peptidoglycan/LPS O-acetylase OafA/YrhL